MARKYQSLKIKYQQKTLILLYDAMVAWLSFPIAAGILKISAESGRSDVALFGTECLFVFTVKTISLLWFNTSRGVWRYSGTLDLLLILKAVTSSSLLLALFAPFAPQLPLSVFINDWFVTLFLLGGGRFAFRLWTEAAANNGSRVVALVVGAGNAGEQLIRDLNKNADSSVSAVGIVDDDPSKLGTAIHGIRVLGRVEQIPEIARKKNATHVFIAIPSATKKQTKRIGEICLKANLQMKTLPDMRDIVDGKVHVSILRPFNIEDLLGRLPVQLNKDAIHKSFSGKIVMITGAGGSIGSELCKQVLTFRPRMIVLFDICEFFLYSIEQALMDANTGCQLEAVLGDIRDYSRIEECFAKFRPEVVIHAAAYKHVPMVEKNAREGIRTNIFGTRNVAMAAVKFGVEKFVMISTDKAVNPKNIMGATKRLAERICQNLQKGSKTNFTIVRFGNVLGSAGSVIPKFMEQIAAGGPLTVTHPDITRYFMTIPEASQLVLEAATLGNGGEIFVLDMGQPMKILDLAKSLIEIVGLKVDEDIEIQFTGLRPGEKLYEELLADTENTIPTSHELVRIAKVRNDNDDKSFLDEIETLLTKDFDALQIKQRLKGFVPEYQPEGFQ
jgi:FlaA1/EpsC-like NDP-sugar epimerase